jgi:hypothetical protein
MKIISYDAFQKLDTAYGEMATGSLVVRHRFWDVSYSMQEGFRVSRKRTEYTVGENTYGGLLMYVPVTYLTIGDAIKAIEDFEIHGIGWKEGG